MKDDKKMALELELRSTKQDMLELVNRVCVLENEFERFRNLLKKGVLQVESWDSTNSTDENDVETQQDEVAIKEEQTSGSDSGESEIGGNSFMETSDLDHTRIEIKDPRTLPVIQSFRSQGAPRDKINESKISGNYTEEDDDEDSSSNTSNDTNDTSSSDSNSDNEDKKRQKLPTISRGPNQRKRTGENAASSSQNRGTFNSLIDGISKRVRTGRYRASVWKHYNTVPKPGVPEGTPFNNSVITICKYCEQTVSAQAQRLKHHTTNCLAGKYSTTHYRKHVNKTVIPHKNQIKCVTPNVSTSTIPTLTGHHSIMSQIKNFDVNSTGKSSTEESIGKRGMHLGRKKAPVWQHYINTKEEKDDQGLVTTITTNCKYCGLKVSPQPKRLLLHLQRHHNISKSNLAESESPNV